MPRIDVGGVPLARPKSDCKERPEPEGECYDPAFLHANNVPYCKKEGYARIEGELKPKRQSRYDHDLCGKLRRRLRDNFSSSGDRRWRPDGVAEHAGIFVYGKDGQLSERRILLPPDTEVHRKWLYQFDDSNRRAVEVPESESLKNLRDELFYDEKGNLIRREEETQHRLFKYDEQCRRLRKSIKLLETDEVRLTNTWEYRDGGRVIIDTRYPYPPGSEKNVYKHRLHYEDGRIAERWHWSKDRSSDSGWEFLWKTYVRYDAKGRRVEARTYEERAASPERMPESLTYFKYDCAWR